MDSTSRSFPCYLRIITGVGLLCATAVWSACSDSSPVAPGPTVNRGVSAVQESAFRDLSMIARGLDLAMNSDTEARQIVRDALRDSPWSAHRLRLAELWAVPRAATLEKAISRALGISPADLQALLNRAPTADFFLTSAQQRRTWQATSGVYVAANVGDIGVIFAPSGEQVPDFRNDSPLFVVKPAEPRLRRADAASVRAGEVIQSRDEASFVIRKMEHGQEFSDAGVYLGSPTRPATRSGESVSPLVVIGTDTTFVNSIYSYRCDALQDPTVEIKLEASFYSETGRLVRSADWRMDFDCETSYYPASALLAEVLPDSSYAHVHIQAWELDGWPNPDDNFGSRDFCWDDRDQTRTIYHGSEAGLNLNLHWMRRASSTPTSLGVVPDPVNVNTGDGAYAYAYIWDQYGYDLNGTVTWSTDDPSVATVQSNGARQAIVTGQGPWSTTIHASGRGVTGHATVNVTPCIGNICPQRVSR